MKLNLNLLGRQLLALPLSALDLVLEAFNSLFIELSLSSLSLLCEKSNLCASLPLYTNLFTGGIHDNPAANAKCATCYHFPDAKENVGTREQKRK